MVLFPTPALGWNNVFRKKPKYLMIARRGAGSIGGLAIAQTVLLASDDLETFKPYPLVGDQKSKGPTGGYFLWGGFLRHGSHLFIYGAEQLSTSANRPVIYRTHVDDPGDWEEVASLTGGSGFRRITAMAANASYIVACESGLEGRLLVSTNGGDSFSTYSPTFPLSINDIAAGPEQFAIGISSSNTVTQTGRTAANPTSTWTTRNFNFNHPTSANLNGGNVMLAGSSLFVVISPRCMIATASISSPTSWTRRTTPIGHQSGNYGNFSDVGATDGASTFLVGGGAKSGGDEFVFMRSTDGTTWAEPTAGNRPWSNGAAASVNQFEYEDGRFFARMGWRVAYSDDGGASWAEPENNLGKYGGTYTALGLIPLAA